MKLAVRDKADTVATWRWISVALMEMLARWVPTSPELEAKALFGRHIWEFAQHADHFGRRTAELRAAMHENRAPLSAYHTAIGGAGATAATAARLAAFYDAVVPDLERRYSAWLGQADPLMDEPTVRIVERALSDLARMRRERDALLNDRPDLVSPGDAGAKRLAAELAAITDCVEYRPAAAGADSA